MLCTVTGRRGAGFLTCCKNLGGSGHIRCDRKEGSCAVTCDQERFVALYRRHYDDVLRYARRRIDEESARDVTAETFLVALRRSSAVPAEPLPWLYGEARRMVANAQRTQRRAGRLDARLYAAALAGVPTAQPDPADEVGERLRIQQALARRSPRDQEVIQLVAWEWLDINDVARVVGCSPAAATVRMHRARRRLARALEDSDLGRSRTARVRPAAQRT
ncbi:MAG: hypothetical protein DLM56_10650 [Pseudonocardiales bacterium]|nr:MAG: hypothetical protein DLM56_10650 [Pseudonocardiales bacterium]